MDNERNDKNIKNAKGNMKRWQNNLRGYKVKGENMAREQKLDCDQTFAKINKLGQDIGSLKRKNVEIEKEQDDLKKKHNVGLMENLSTTIEGKMKDLECPVCFHTAETPIYQCTRGHLIYNKCLSSLKICPECRTKYPVIQQIRGEDG